MNIIIVANAQTKGDALSGADRIFIECAKRWAEKGHAIQIITCEEGYEMCRRYGLGNASYINASSRYRLPLHLLYVLRMIKGSILTLRMASHSRNVVVYSSSDFWPDSVPAWILKMRFPSVKWVAAFYLFAPSPFGNGSPYKGWRRLRGLFYYLSQLPVYSLIRRYADMIWVTSEPDRWRFVDSRLLPNKVVAVRGGVDVETPALMPEPVEKRFDAVFIGRFHPQKGVLELVDIWKYVCGRKRDAKLAMVGAGDLEADLVKKIIRYELQNNIVLFGFKDGVEKFKIFKDSKVVVHPAIYDSGGMAACEAMVCGLPGISFDLPALGTYYPKGMLKTPCFDIEEFAENILRLLNDKELYKKTAEDALDWAKKWDWDQRADDLLVSILELSENCRPSDLS